MAKRYVLLVTIGDGLAVAPAEPSTQQTVAFSYAPTVLGGTAPYTFELLANGMPDGEWTFDPETGGMTSAYPETRGTFGYDLLIRDANWDYDLIHHVTITVYPYALS